MSLWCCDVGVDNEHNRIGLDYDENYCNCVTIVINVNMCVFAK